MYPIKHCAVIGSGRMELKVTMGIVRAGPEIDFHEHGNASSGPCQQYFSICGSTGAVRTLARTALT